MILTPEQARRKTVAACQVALTKRGVAVLIVLADLANAPAHAAEDALFTVDDGTVLVWRLRHVDTGGKRRTFGSLLHGTMASGMASAIGLQKCQTTTSLASSILSKDPPA